MHEEALSAAITAGGRSSRFGSDKALAVISGERLLDRVARRFPPADARVLVAPPGRYVLPGWTPLPDTRPGEGPLAGLEAALGACPDGWVMYAGVDLPGLTPAYWAALLNARTAGARSVAGLDASGHVQPLAALYHTSLRGAVSALLDAGERRLRAALLDVQQVPWASLEAQCPDAYRNVNTPADLPDA
ncbi:molybdenum cofactor guanylyltransferase [Deinococcus maricopensis]|uniref:Probable molybdenum cofactor guanylyltransferase n=1 Tax=Deinococcus maricopensis (strain DSM 21211 / LMG 22137 / NRRL B-23946 / LB-34) TaxID=709986 RepID=E8U6H1_DEIML|nr:molybdenum cofactor guanylyltransferase [Deinococcus maricopensis]ADV66660.1 Molybdopterin-guanine dinucleotide biosynthesis protein A [Deinococcus maricopensis DSM 21211]